MPGNFQDFFFGGCICQKRKSICWVVNGTCEPTACLKVWVKLHLDSVCQPALATCDKYLLNICLFFYLCRILVTPPCLAMLGKWDIWKIFMTVNNEVMYNLRYKKTTEREVFS